jgi:hypothetical protein
MICWFSKKIAEKFFHDTVIIHSKGNNDKFHDLRNLLIF